MSLEIVPISPDSAHFLSDFVRAVYPSRIHTPEFLKWRYLDCPSQRGVMGVQNGAAVAMLGAFLKVYRCGTEDIPCLETHEWARLPAVPGVTGLRVLQQVMKLPEIIIGVGGNSQTRNLVGKMRWQEQEAIRYVLPLGSQVGAEYLKRRYGAPRLVTNSASAIAGLYFRPRKVRPPRNWSVVPVAFAGAEVQDLYQGFFHEFVQLPDLNYIHWLSQGFPGIGHFTTLYFLQGEALRGWSLSRVFASLEERTASILEVFSQNADEKLYAWMISETVQAISGLHPLRVTALASTKSEIEGLRANRFLPAGKVPISIYERNRTVAPVRASLLMSDECLRPYPSAWGSSRLAWNSSGNGGSDAD